MLQFTISLTSCLLRIRNAQVSWYKLVEVCGHYNLVILYHIISKCSLKCVYEEKEINMSYIRNYFLINLGIVSFHRWCMQFIPFRAKRRDYINLILTFLYKITFIKNTLITTTFLLKDKSFTLIGLSTIYSSGGQILVDNGNCTDHLS